MNFPDNLKYTSDHEWVSLDGNEAIIGITDFAQRELGDIVYIESSAMGSVLLKEAVFGSVEAVKTVSDLFMPVSGKLVSLNALLEDNPELVNDDPYGEGWILRVEITDPSELDGLLDAEAYRSLIGK